RWSPCDRPTPERGCRTPRAVRRLTRLPTVQFSFQFPPAEDAPAQARAALEVFDQILSPAVLEDLQLVVSELVTNSVKFGPKRPITLALSIGGDGLVKGEVIDQGDGEEAIVEMTPEPTV